MEHVSMWNYYRSNRVTFKRGSFLKRRHRYSSTAILFTEHTAQWNQTLLTKPLIWVWPEKMCWPASFRMKHLESELMAIDYPLWKEKRPRINILKISQDILKTIMTWVGQLIAIILLLKDVFHRHPEVSKRKGIKVFTERMKFNAQLK